MEIIAVANQKGGVAKTTTSHALAIEFSETLKKRVLLIDFDPQSSLTTIFNLKGKMEKKRWLHVLMKSLWMRIIILQP